MKDMIQISVGIGAGMIGALIGSAIILVLLGLRGKRDK